MQTDIPPPLNLPVGESPKAAAHTSPPPIVHPQALLQKKMIVIVTVAVEAPDHVQTPPQHYQCKADLLRKSWILHHPKERDTLLLHVIVSHENHVHVYK